MIINPYIFGGFSNTYSVDFDGFNESIGCGTPSELQSATTFSVSCWIKTDDATALQGVCKWYTGAFGNWFEISIGGTRANDVQFVLSTSGTIERGYTTSNPISDTTWHHIACVYDGGGTGNAGKMKIYVDGSNETLSFVGTIASTGPSLSSSTLAISARYTGIDYFNGKIDEFAIFDYALSSANVTTIYNSGAPTDLDDLATSPVHWYRMGDGSDDETTFYDVGTNPINGTGNNLESGDLQTDVPT